MLARQCAADARMSAWEIVHQLVRALGDGGAKDAARLVRSLGSAADAARELAYRLYSLSERKRRADDALAYNSLVQQWPDIADLARAEEQQGLF